MAKQIVMTRTSLRGFSVFVSVTIKYFTISNGINALWSIYY